MAKTIINAFNEFKTNIEITGLQKSTVSIRQQNIRDAVEKERKVLDSFLTGSYSRSTLIAPLNEADIDIFIVLDSEYYEKDGQANLLDKIKRTILKTYPQTPKISRNGQAVTITFTDFAVDVVPAFNRQGGGYLIPDSINHIWISTNPKLHVDYVSQENSIHEGNLIPLIKMLKTWNKNIGSVFSSFYLEILICKILKNVTISNFSSGVRYIFDKGREQIKYNVQDPANSSEQISGLIGISVDDAISRFTTAYSRAIKAEQLEKESKIEDSINEWRKIFGDRFPAYN
jgi:hypothetical protein